MSPDWYRGDACRETLEAESDSCRATLEAESDSLIEVEPMPEESMSREKPAFHMDNEPVPFLPLEGTGTTAASSVARTKAVPPLLVGLTSRSAPGDASEELPRLCWEALVASLFTVQAASPLNDPRPCISRFDPDFLKGRLP